MRTRPLIRFLAVSALAATIDASGTVAAHTAVPGTMQPPPAPRPPAQPTAPVRDPGGNPATTPAPPGKAALSGTITTAAGQPAPGARVMLNGGDGPGRTTMTDARGQFVFEGLRTGRYYVNVTKPGFVSLSYGQRRVNSPGTPIPLNDGERRVIDMQLPRSAVITGMILDERGEPSINTQVRGMRYTMMNGRRRAQQVANDATDDRGIYRLHSLQPGEYAVCAVARNMGPMNDAQRIQMETESLRRAIENAPAAVRQQMAERLAQLQAQRVDQTEPNLGYAPVCFPGSSGAPSPSVTVAAGEERSGVDLQMVMIPVARIEGTVVGPGGSIPTNLQLTLVNADESMADVERQGTGLQQPSGRFSFQNISPGRYTIMARTMSVGPPRPPGATVAGKEPVLWGMAEIAVNGQDVSDVVIELHRGIMVMGQVSFQPTTLAPPTDLSRTQVSIFPFMPDSGPMMMMGPPPQAKVEASGRFTITDVVPGKYRMSAGLIGMQGWVVDSIMAGDQDVLDFPLEIKGSRDVTGVAVTFGDRVSELSGTIANEKGEPATEQTILLYPTDHKYWTPQSRRIRAIRAGADGLFNFRVIPPGEYRLTTLVDPEPGIWYDREVLEQLDGSSIRIVIGEGEKKVEHVRIR